LILSIGETVESGGVCGRTRAGGFRQGGEHERLAFEGFAELYLQRVEAVGRREGSEGPGEVERLAQRRGAGTLVTGERVGRQLDDATARDAMGRQRVARLRGPVDECDVVPRPGQQQRGRGAGTAGSDDDDVVMS
jgi:hypothetical protein